MMMACVLVIAGSNNLTNGNRKANVFPEPVADKRSVLLLVEIASMEASCISFNDLIFNRVNMLSVATVDVDI